MKTGLSKNSVMLIAIIAVAVLTAFVFVIGFTALSVTAYIFAVIGVILLYCGTSYMLSSPETYPWFAAFPIRIWQYITAQLILSGAVIATERLFERTLSLQWFILVHIVLLAVCLITLIFLNQGKEIIVARDNEIKEKTAVHRFMQIDTAALIGKYPEYKEDLQQVADALRYSDPMTHPSLAVIEQQIQSDIAAMDNPDEVSQIPQRCRQLLKQIADRNMRAKAMK